MSSTGNDHATSNSSVLIPQTTSMFLHPVRWYVSLHLFFCHMIFVRARDPKQLLYSPSKCKPHQVKCRKAQETPQEPMVENIENLVAVEIFNKGVCLGCWQVAAQAGNPLMKATGSIFRPNVRNVSCSEYYLGMEISTAPLGTFENPSNKTLKDIIPSNYCT